MRSAHPSLRLLLLVSWMGLITYWSGQANLPIDEPSFAMTLHGLQHGIAHVITFGLLGLLADWSFDNLKRPATLAVLLVAGFGVFDEWHQSFTPGRRSAVDDWLIDTLSAAAAVYLWRRLRASRWHARVAPLAPAAVAIVFAFAIGFALRGPALLSANAGSGTWRETARSPLDQLPIQQLGIANHLFN